MKFRTPKVRDDERGFITMIVVLVLILAVAIFFAYARVKSAHQG
jgi:cell division protein FtsL